MSSRALERWTTDGMPNEPERWLVRVAHNALIDTLRREPPTESLAEHDDRSADPSALDDDDELRLVFLCCNPVLPRAAQIALVLNVAFGLTARQIANAFVSDECTVAQRIVRAKQRLRDHGVCFDLPEGRALPPRLATVLETLYLVFSEGHNPTEDDVALDASLCEQALRLARLLTQRSATATPAALALRALLCFHASRIPARLADDGSLLLIQEQDRSRWDHSLITEALCCLESARSGEAVSRFHLEAAIAACHALAPTYAATDWTQIVELYDMLKVIAPSLVIDVNRALAIGMLSGARIGLDELDAIPEHEVLGRYPYALAAYADLHAALGQMDEARQYLDRALGHQASPAQRALLQRRRAALEHFPG